jgi:hypothetical protein
MKFPTAKKSSATDAEATPINTSWLLIDEKGKIRISVSSVLSVFLHRSLPTELQTRGGKRANRRNTVGGGGGVLPHISVALLAT